MTGFGSCRKESGPFFVNVEIKTVNHRFCEYNIRMPRSFLSIEERIKKTIGRHIQRGRAEVLVTVEGAGQSGKKLHADWELLDQYFGFAKEAGGKYGLNPMEVFKTVLGHDDIIHIEELETGKEELTNLILEAVEEASEMLGRMRLAEGAALKEDLLNNLGLCREKLAALKEIAPSVAVNYRARLQARMAELLGMEPEEQRVLMEAAIFADKSDISEEIARLASHIAQFEAILEAGGAAGRKLDFLVQEMNRETNTIGSKANDSLISSGVVELKSLLEKMKEQVQNVE